MSDAAISIPSPTAAAPAAESAKRGQIVEGARQVFLARGFDGASMGEIARAAGVSKGTLYVYFDSKQALFAELVRVDKRQTAEQLFELDAEDHDVARVLARLGASYLDLMLRPDHIASLRTVIGVAEKFPEVGQALFDAGPRVGIERLAAYLDWQVAGGYLAIPDSALAASQFLGMLMAPGVMPSMVANAPAPDAGRRALLVSRAVEVFIAAHTV